MKTKILQMLRQNPEAYISGQELCKQLGVSRTAVWKVINQLKEAGYEIEAIQNKGYRIVSAPDVMTEGEIRSKLKTKWIANTIICLEETGSTNSEIKKRAEEGVENGTLVTANYQSDGRGRRGRAWEFSKGNAIAMSILLRPKFEPEYASMLTLVMALSAVEAINQVCHLKGEIKWPNDIIINKKKVCGILTEMSAEPDYIHYVVIGVGINVNENNFSKQVQGKATSLYRESGQKWNRADMIAAIMKHFEKNYESYKQTLDMSLLIEKYSSYLINKGQMVKVLEATGEFEGIAKGINLKGELLVEKESGEVATVYAGEVSVRGLYGYV